MKTVGLGEAHERSTHHAFLNRARATIGEVSELTIDFQAGAGIRQALWLGICFSGCRYCFGIHK